MGRLASPQRRRNLLGLWLAVLAMCALNLQVLGHYDPRMLDGSICSLSGAVPTEVNDQGKASHGEAACALCCAHVQVAIDTCNPPAPVRLAAVADYLVPAPTAAPSWPLWSAGKPRGPPGLG